MMKDTGRVFITDVLRGEPVAFESTQTLDEHLKKIDRDDIFYEDEHAVAYLQRDDDPGSNTHWEHRIVVALRGHVPTLLDIDVCDQRATGALLRAIQAVAFKLQLYNKGFEIRSDVLPPLQRRGFLEIKIRSGKHQNGAEGAGTARYTTP